MNTEMTRGPERSAEVIELPLDSLQLNEQFQPRLSGVDQSHVDSLVAAWGHWPPIVVARLDLLYAVIDGFHRVAAARTLGLLTIQAVVAESRDGVDLRALAFDLNARHGKQLSLGDRRAEAERRLRAAPTTSNLEIARSVGLSPSTLTAIRSALEAAGSIPELAERVSTDGRTYPVTPRRLPGELPPDGPLTSVADLLFGIRSKSDQRARRIARYVERVCTSLEDQEQVPWDDAAEAATAVRAVLPEEDVRDLAASLGWYASRLVDVASALGYDQDAE